MGQTYLSIHPGPDLMPCASIPVHQTATTVFGGAADSE
jgi:hypothetical protein